jgi:hypothetical protein
LLRRSTSRISVKRVSIGSYVGKLFHVIVFLQMKVRRRTTFGKDGRRKHHHWQVTVFYNDGETFGRVYSDHEKAANFANRQKKSPVVKMARVTQLS